MDFNLWIDSLTKPISTFKREKKKANLGEGALHIAIAGLITGFITGLTQMVAGSIFTSQLYPVASGFIGVAAFFASLILTPILSVVFWLILSGILYIFALLFGGKGNYTTQSYLYAIYYAPLMIISTVLGLIPFAGIFLSFLVMIYGLYLLTMALKIAHNYSTGRAVLTWLVPVVIIIVIIVVLLGLAVAFILGAFTGQITGGFF